MAAVPPSTARRGLRVIQTAGCDGEWSACEEKVERGEHVLCRGHGGPHVGTVVGQRTAATGERYLLCRWYYRPEESEAGRQPFDSSSELLESDNVDIVPQSAVLSRCRVLPPDEFVRERDVQIAAIRSARQTEFFEQHPVTGASRAAAEPWGKTFGTSPTPEEVVILDVMYRLLRFVQSEVRPDECRRPLQNWLGMSRAAPKPQLSQRRLTHERFCRAAERCNGQRRISCPTRLQDCQKPREHAVSKMLSVICRWSSAANFARKIAPVAQVSTRWHRWEHLDASRSVLQRRRAEQCERGGALPEAAYS